MKKIGLLSDTHSHIYDGVMQFLKGSDQIWHAGDIGDESVLKNLEELAPVVAVYGNIDTQDLRFKLRENLCFEVEQVRVYMTHIGGRPGKFTSQAINILKSYKPALFVCGHSHIALVKYDENYQVLCLNPGAAGQQGWHTKVTAMRFEIDGKEIKNLEILELPR